MGTTGPESRTLKISLEIFLVLIIILTPFFWFATPPRVFVAHTQNGYRNERLGRDMCAMSFLRVSANGFAKNPEKRSQKNELVCIARTLQT